MERKDRLKEAFEYLRKQGKAHTKADIADRMKASRPNVSSAFSGDAKCLTDKFLMRFNSAYGSIFDEDWLLRGEGEMLRPIVTQQGSNNNNKQGNGNTYNSTSSLDKAIDSLVLQIHLTEKAHELTANAQRQTDKAQEQVDRLLAIIENMQGCG